MLEQRGVRVLACPLIIPESTATETPEPAVREFLQGVVAGRFRTVLFYTGIGIEAVLDAARSVEQYEAVLAALAGMTLVARGPKSRAALKRNGLTPTFLAEPPTSDGFVARVGQLQIQGQEVAVVLAGDQPNAAVAAAIAERGARVFQFAPYHYHVPELTTPLREFLQAILQPPHVDWLVFTTTPQVQILLHLAEQAECRAALLQVLRGPVRLAAVGSVTSASLEQFGLVPTVTAPPQQETMIGLIKAMERTSGNDSLSTQPLPLP